MSAITTHVLDTSQGKPASGVPVTLELRTGQLGSAIEWTQLGLGKTDADGRLRTLLPADKKLKPGVYRITFDTTNVSSFYPCVKVVFEIQSPGEHYHIPLLISPYGYSTYRGS